MTFFSGPVGFATGGYFEATAVSATAVSSSAVSFTNVPIGAEHSDRVVVVSLVAWESGSSQRTWTVGNTEIGGVNPTALATSSRDDSNQSITALFARALPTGTTTTITVGYSNSVTYHAIQVYRVIRGSASAYSTNTDSNNSSSTLTLSLNTPSSGVVFAAATRDINDNYPTWTGLDGQSSVDGPAFSGSHAAKKVTAATPYVITGSSSSAADEAGCSACISF